MEELSYTSSTVLTASIVDSCGDVQKKSYPISNDRGNPGGEG